MILRTARLCLVAGLMGAAPPVFAQVPPSVTQRPAPPIPPALSKSDPDIVQSFKLDSPDIDSVLGALEIYCRPRPIP